ncbi:hypothetical protein HPB50_007993 [Hyalomma asiaticum]|uniref:Uncharacterized protein n=1 Tax=Hyalomma asiaticum TaxID=266040 RepID=A0ACB7RXJ5_HYAAI|nr:hypothetical protein HPB50_007993 [Hyalomma asiaticum]
MPLKSKHKSSSFRKSVAVVPVRPVLSLRPQHEKDSLLRLPDGLLVAILESLDWEHRLKMARLCRRLRKIVNSGPWMRCARFTVDDIPALFTSVMVRPRTDVVTELDVCFYIMAKSERLAKAISLCTNLEVLRCVHSRILSTTLVNLLKDKLRKLECLYWSVPENDPVDIEPPAFLAGNSEDPCHSECSVMPPKLRKMYVEVLCTPANINFICSVLRHCHALRSLQFHERESETEVYDAACRVLKCYYVATSGKYYDFTYTVERRPNNVTLPTDPSARKVDYFSVMGTCIDASRGIAVRQTPLLRRNCVTLGELECMLASGTLSHQQLTILLNECGNDATGQLNKLRLYANCRRLKALTLMVLPDAAAVLQRDMRNQASLCNFIRCFVALVELNLSAFHFSPNFDWSSVLATGGLDSIRSLALAACALCKPRRLQFLGRASFKLRELDVRCFPKDVPKCDVCHEPTTCDDDALEPLRCLDRLRRLTLCDIFQALSLRFLLDCTSIRELRLRNMGVWSKKGAQDLTPMASIWPQLHALKWESAFAVDDLGMFCRMPVAPTMTRFCLAVHFARADIRVPVNDIIRMQECCPAVDALHVHLFYPGRDEQRAFFPKDYFQRADDVLSIDGAVWLPTADKVWLCDCSNYIGLTAPHGVKLNV